MIKVPFIDRVKYFVERQFVKGAGFQFLVVAAIIGALSLAGGAAIAITGSDMSFLDSVWWAFLRMTDPGYLGDDEGAWRRLVSTALTISGYVVFMGTLVAIMTRWLIARMLEFERGLTHVTLKNHVVVIGWTNRTIPLLRELFGAGPRGQRFKAVFGVRRLRAVVLTEDVSPILRQSLTADPVIGRAGARDVVLRYGSVLEEEAIRRAACLQAAAVIMPAGYGHGSKYLDQDVETIRGLLSMDARAARNRAPSPLVVAEIQDERRVDVVRSAYRGPLEIIASDQIANQLLVQTILHPGLSHFLSEVLTSGDGNELHVRAPERLAGASLRDAATRFPDAIVLGMLRKSAAGEFEARLAMPSSEIIHADDLIVVLARSAEDIVPLGSTSGTTSTIPRPGKSIRPHRSRNASRILILGWGRRVPNLIAELADYPEMKFEIDLMSMTDIEIRTNEIQRYSSRCTEINVNHIEADYLLAGELERLALEDYRSIVLLSSDQLESAEEADARVIVGQRIIENLLKHVSRRPQLLVDLSEPANEAVSAATNIETLISPLLLSHVMAQVALRREIRSVFNELFTEGGAEVDFREPAPSLLGSPQSFSQLEAHVARQGDTLLGVLHPDSGLAINPARTRSFTLSESDRLCVLTRFESHRRS